MSTIHDDPAFPMPGLSGLPSDQFVYGQHGMSKRELFAAMAMQGILASAYFAEHCAESGVKEGSEQRAAARAVQYADALLAEIEKERS